MKEQEAQTSVPEDIKCSSPAGIYRQYKDADIDMSSFILKKKGQVYAKLLRSLICHHQQLEAGRKNIKWSRMFSQEKEEVVHQREDWPF